MTLTGSWRQPRRSWDEGCLAGETIERHRLPGPGRRCQRVAGSEAPRRADGAQEPRSYTVEPGRQVTDAWGFASGYDLSVHGPNGFFRRFKGDREARPR
jgi:hypothetical protein